MAWLACPYLGMPVELTDERAQHIADQHPDLLPAHRDALERTLADPDRVRRSDRLAGARIFTRWFDDIARGKHVVVVVVADPAPARRGWINHSVHCAAAERRCERVDEKLMFHYDRAGDILYVETRPPYTEQESEELGDEVVARLNPDTGDIEALEVLFFSTRLLRGERFEVPLRASLRPTQA